MDATNTTSSPNLNLAHKPKGESSPDVFVFSRAKSQIGLLANGSENTLCGKISDTLSNSKSRKKRNKMSFTMKKVPEVDIKVTECVPVSTSNRKLSSFSCRADVIYKKILRDFRRYYMNDFMERTNFRNIRRGKSKEFIVQWLKNYCKDQFGQTVSDVDEVVFALGTLVAPSELSRTSVGKVKKSRKEINKIHDTLYKFSITKVDKLLEDKYVAFLLKHFILNSGWKEELISMSEVSAKSYETAFNMILGRATEIISQ